MSQQFHGIVTATATPFNDDQSVDEGALRSLIDWYIESGIHGISIGGSQGEFFSCSTNERLRQFEVAVEAIDGRVPLYAGTGAITTKESIEITKAAESIGVDLAMVITPFFISPSADELVGHYTAIAKATKLPVLLYNNPPRTGVNIAAEVLARCAPVDNIIGIKDSSGDATQLGEYLRLAGRDTLLFAGRDTLLLTTITLGGVGGISPTANVFPKIMVKLYEAARAGDLETAHRLGDIIAPSRIAWSLGSFPVVIKEAMTMVGHSAGPPRAPISPLPPDRRQKLQQIVDEIAKHEATM
jgi:4-hydroxy-tetrahydrodipicolinate synthase